MADTLEELRTLCRAMEQSAAAVIITDVSGLIVYVNPRFTQATGYTLTELSHVTPRILKATETHSAVYRELWECLTSGRAWRGQLLNRKKNGDLYWSEQSIAPVRDGTGVVTHYVGIGEDITDRKRKEKEYLQSQKLETVAQLAGGVAHDFNNLLTAIMGYCQLALANPHNGSDLNLYLNESIKATERAAGLTNRLLAFSRRQVIKPKAINFNHLLINLDKMLRGLIGDNVELVTVTESSLASVKADPGQMEQLLTNLAVNARDAMPDGGRLTIKTENWTSTEPREPREPRESRFPLHGNASPGRYVLLSVTDTGIGMTGEVKDHIFEPFFTTKKLGEGTGLGLSTCHGIVAQNDGFLMVDSEPGQGSCFSVFLPVTEDPPDLLGAETLAPGLGYGNETVLLAEDEPQVRKMAALVLQERRYRVLVAGDGAEALRVASDYPGKIDILVTDVVMPNVGGVELARCLRASQPDIKVLFTSGYTEGSTFRQDDLPSGTGFQQKPYMPEALAARVREILDT